MNRGELGVDLPPHGDRRRFQHRVHPCDCDLCREANNRYHREYRQRRRSGERTAAVVLAGPSPACRESGRVKRTSTKATCVNKACPVLTYSGAPA